MPLTGVDTPLEMGEPSPQGPASLEPPIPLENTEEGADSERCGVTWGGQGAGWLGCGLVLLHLPVPAASSPPLSPFLLLPLFLSPFPPFSLPVSSPSSPASFSPLPPQTLTFSYLSHFSLKPCPPLLPAAWLLLPGDPLPIPQPPTLLCSMPGGPVPLRVGGQALPPARPRAAA